MSKRRLLFFSVLAVFLAGGSVIVYKLNEEYKFFPNNSVGVSATAPLLLDKIKIEYGLSVNTINRMNDLDLFKNPGKYTVIFNGDYKDEIPNEYGENDFLVTYDNRYYFSFRQFKMNWRHDHKYYFHLVERNGVPHLEVDIQGEDSMYFERPMHLVAEAESFRCNVPLDSAGNIHNGVELDRKKAK